MAELDLALVFTPDPWVEELHRHLADHGGARVLHLVVDPAMVLHEHFDVLVASWRWPALTPGLVAEVHGLGRAVLGVADRDERGATDVLHNCGVDAIVPSDAAPWEYLDALAVIEASWADRGGAPVPQAENAPRATSSDRRAHPWIAVCGPAGAGRTEIAIELARALAAVLVDADEVAPAIAPRLGLPLEPNVRAAIDAVEFGEGHISDALQRVPGLTQAALCALPSSGAWLDVRPPELLRVLHECCAAAPLVIDTAPLLDDVGGPLRGRYALARAIVADADIVVAVGTATPLGVVRLLGWLADAERLRPRRPAHVLLNRGAGGAFRRAELANELLRSYRPCSLAHIPDDERVRAAGWNGALVARGPFTKAVAVAATRLIDDVDRARRARGGGVVIGDVRASGEAASGRVGGVESHDAYDSIRREVLRAIERRRLRPDRDLADVRAEVERAVDDYQHRAQFGEARRLADPAAVVERIVRSIADLGPLTDLLARPDVEEIFIDGARIAYLDGEGRLRGLAEPTNEDENRRVIDRLLAPSDRQLSAQYPLVQSRVLDGAARLTAAIPPVADRLSVTLRRYVVRHVALDGLVRRNFVTAPAAAFLGALMQMRSRVVVSGEPGAGKTTLLAALLAAAPAHHCIRCCEEIRELSVPFPHGAYYEVRPPGLDGGGAIDLRALVRFTLAMRPDRIVVGEVRGGEAFELTRAMNAGCGFCCTVHANGAVDALDALVNAALMAGENVTERVVRKVFSEALDVVVHVDRDDGRSGPGGGEAGPSGVRRQITEIVAVAPALGDGFTCEPLFVRDGLGRPLVWTGAVPARLESRIDRAAAQPGTLRALLGADHRGSP